MKVFLDTNVVVAACVADGLRGSAVRLKELRNIKIENELQARHERKQIDQLQK